MSALVGGEMSASCSGAWHSRNRTFGILRNDLWNNSRCMIGRRSMWKAGRSVWDSWSECCDDWDFASHPDKAGMHIICLPVSGVMEELTARAATSAWHAHHCALFRSKHEAAHCLRMASVTVRSCQLFRTERAGKVIVKVTMCLYSVMTNWLLTVGQFGYFCVSARYESCCWQTSI